MQTHLANSVHRRLANVLCPHKALCSFLIILNKVKKNNGSITGPPKQLNPKPWAEFLLSGPGFLIFRNETVTSAMTSAWFSR